MTVVSAAIRVELDACFLANAHVLELRLLEVRGDPHLIQWDHGEQLFSRIDIQSDHDLFRDLASYRRRYFGVSEVQLRLFQGGSSLVYVRFGRKGFGARRGNALRPGFGILVVRFRFYEAALRLLNGL